MGLARLLFLLGYARDPGFRPDLVAAAEDAEIWPVLAETLARLAEGALARGVLQGYRVEEDALRVVRGRIRIGDQLARRPYGGETRLAPRQYGTWLDGPGVPGQPGVRMWLDVVHLVGDEPRLVFDAKYKVADGTGRYPNADLFQMLAYCTALGVPRAWLVYAGGRRPAERLVRNTGVRIVEYPLDLGVTPGGLAGSGPAAGGGGVGGQLSAEPLSQRPGVAVRHTPGERAPARALTVC